MMSFPRAVCPVRGNLLGFFCVTATSLRTVFFVPCLCAVLVCSGEMCGVGPKCKCDENKLRHYPLIYCHPLCCMSPLFCRTSFFFFVLAMKNFLCCLLAVVKEGAQGIAARKNVVPRTRTRARLCGNLLARQKLILLLASANIPTANYHVLRGRGRLCR